MRSNIVKVAEPTYSSPIFDVRNQRSKPAQPTPIRTQAAKSETSAIYSKEIEAGAYAKRGLVGNASIGRGSLLRGLFY